MRIALTHNLRLREREEEAEFDSKETVDAVAAGLERLGHRVEPVEVAGPASRTVARLEAFSPDLVFNMARGHRGRVREAFYPALFEELGLAYTGSDPYALSMTLDKHTTKIVTSMKGVLTPRAVFVERLEQLQVEGLRFPVLVKPNFEGSSKGITQESVVEEAAQLSAVVSSLLRRFPSGVLVEEFVAGRDVSVPFLQGALGDRSAVLSPVEYVFDAEARATRRWSIYDYALKADESERVQPHIAGLGEESAARLVSAARRVYDTFGIRDLGRVDFRVSSDGTPYFLEVNALPSLESGAGLLVAAAKAGLDYDAVLARIVESACIRHGIDVKKLKSPSRRQGPLKVGLSYNLKRVKPNIDGTSDEQAEYDAPSTIDAIREALRSHEHEVIDLEATGDLPTRLLGEKVDVVFNIAEGFKGRSREGQVPSLLELLDIPYTGSDPATLSIALDKSLAKRMVRQHGVLTPLSVLMHTGREKLPAEMRFPVIAKPNAEGSSKGVHEASVVHSDPELREVVRKSLEKYKQPVLVEEYVRGREFTVGLLGERRPRVLPIMEIVFLDASDPTPVYSFAAKQDWNSRIRYDAPARLSPAEQKAIEKAARESFIALGCRDVARIDFRMDAEGRVYFIECNPLPGLTPGWSDLVLIANAAKMDYRTLIGDILAPAIRRFREREREKKKEGGRPSEKGG